MNAAIRRQALSRSIQDRREKMLDRVALYSVGKVAALLLRWF
jgi:hypothetical protein